MCVIAVCRSQFHHRVRSESTVFISKTSSIASRPRITSRCFVRDVNLFTMISEMTGGLPARRHQYFHIARFVLIWSNVMSSGRPSIWRTLWKTLPTWYIMRYSEVVVGQISDGGSLFRSRNESLRARVRVWICGPHLRT